MAAVRILYAIVLACGLLGCTFDNTTRGVPLKPGVLTRVQRCWVDRGLPDVWPGLPIEVKKVDNFDEVRSICRVGVNEVGCLITTSRAYVVVLADYNVLDHELRHALCAASWGHFCAYHTENEIWQNWSCDFDL